MTSLGFCLKSHDCALLGSRISVELKFKSTMLALSDLDGATHKTLLAREMKPKVFLATTIFSASFAQFCGLLNAYFNGSVEVISLIQSDSNVTSFLNGRITDPGFKWWN